MDIEEAFRHFGRGKAKATGLIKKIRMADKGMNLERLGRTLALFTDKSEVHVVISAERMAAARKRVLAARGQAV